MRIRFTEKSLQPAREAAEKMKARIGEMNTFLSKFDSEFWKLVSNDLDTRIEILISERDKTLKDDRALVANTVEEKAYRTIKDLPSRVLAVRDNLMKDFNTLSKDIHDRADRIKE